MPLSCRAGPLLALGVFTAVLASAQPQHAAFERISEADGLPGGAVTGIIQDRQGFMWFGTWEGLARYDGYEFTHFHNDPRDSTSRSAGHIEWLFEDRQGYIWIGLYGGGLNRYDPESGAFTRYRHDPDDPNSITDSDAVNYVFEDRHGFVWIGFARSGLDRYDPRTGRFTHFRHDPNDPSSLSDDRVRVIYEDRHGALWVGTGDPLRVGANAGGLNRYDLEGAAFVQYQHDPEDPGSLTNSAVQAIYEDSRGTLWVGTAANGLNALDRERDAFIRHTPGPDETSLPSPPFSPRAADVKNPVGPFVAAVLESRDGMLWIGSHDHGISRYDPATDTQTHFEHDPGDPSSLGDNRIFRLYESHDGTIWVGTFGGLFKLDPRAARFHEYRHDSNDPTSVGPYVVAALHVDGAGELWVGTNRGGLQQLDRETATFTSFPMELPDAPTRDYSVSAIHEDRSGTLWVGLVRPYGPPGTLWRLDRRSGRVVPTGLPVASAIDVIHEDEAHLLWIATAEGLYRFDRRSHAVAHFRHELRGPDGQPLACRVLRDGPRGTLWLGTENGLFQVDKETGAFTMVLEDVRVTALEDGADGALWIGTEADGLLLHDLETRGRTSFTTADGLPHNSIRAMTADGKGFLWVNTEQGLSRFDTKQRAFQHFDLSAGLPGYGFTRSAAAGSHGNIYFGGVGGIMTVLPNLMDSAPPRIVLTGLRYSDRGRRSPAYADMRLPLSPEAPARLSHTQNDLTFEFVGLHFTLPSGNRYAHMLEGYETEWRQGGVQRSATYTNLSPGTYTFRVKASNADGVWSEEEAAIGFVILPPWWRTGWAWALYAALFLGAVLAVDRIQRRRLIRKERVMATRREAELRTQALEAENRHAAVELEKSRQLEELNAQLKAHERQLEAQNHSLLELDEVKSRFFANISHEFRTPLTLILGPVGDAVKDGETLGGHQLDLIQRNAQRLLRLVNQLLDLSRLDGGGMTLQARHGDLAAFLRNVTLSFTSRAERDRIALSYAAEPERLLTAFDRDKMDKIVSNLLSNALKFTPRGGKVALSLRAVDETLEICVRDTGPGIAKAEIPRLFDRFHQVDASLTRHREGSGIGLALVKELVELHGGTVSVDSQVGFGSTFVVSMPLTRAGAEARRMGETQSEPSRDAGTRNPDHGQGPAPDRDTPPPLGSTALGSATVLLVEDNPDLRTYVRTLLQGDHRIVEARDGEEGLARARQVTPELVIADVMMPRMDGFALTRALRSDEEINHIPILLLTAKADLDSRIEGMGEGADDYLAKPFEAEDLLARVESLIHIRQLLRKRFSGEVLLGPSQIAVPSEDAAFLEHIREAVEAKMEHSNFGVDQLADEVALSPRQLQRRIKEHTNLTAAGYIRMIRLERAAQLLEQEAGQVSQIAYQVGYRDVDHFSKIFKQVYKVVPSAYGRTTP